MAINLPASGAKTRSGSALFPSIRMWMVDLWHGERETPSANDVFSWLKARLVGPEAKRFRWILAVGVLVELILAPLTSWSIDTPGFVSAGISLIYNGSPYAANQFFNPPLGPFLEAPLFAILSIWIPPQSLITNVSAIGPAANATGISTQIPTVAALLALKLPLIGASAVSTLSLLYLAEKLVGRTKANYVAAVWIFNPLLIWATAVHGEVDILAVAATLTFLIAVTQRWYVLAGVALALGIFSKVYPLALLPMAVVLVAALARGRGPSAVSVAVVRLLVGLGLGVLPFLAYLSQLASTYGGLYAQASYGGFNLLLLFNPGIFKPPRGLSMAFRLRNAVIVHYTFEVIFVVALLASVIAADLFSRLDRARSPVHPNERLAYAAYLPLAATLMYQSSPQSENLLLILPLLLILACTGKRWATYVYWAISGAGLYLYFSLLTPVAYFYPLAVMGGSRWISAINHVVISYSANSVLPPRDSWVIAGVVGGGCILVSCLYSILQVFKQGLDTRLEVE